MINFVVRVKSGTERKTLVDAADRVDKAWLPFEAVSTRPVRKRAHVLTVRPIIPFLVCRGTHEQWERLMQHRNVIGPIWFIPERAMVEMNKFRSEVEAAFIGAIGQWMNDSRSFHCSFKEGQSVSLRQRGMDLMPATFRGIDRNGEYLLDTQMMGRTVRIKAEPISVCS